MKSLMKCLITVSRPVAAIMLAGFASTTLSDVTVKAAKDDVVIAVHSDGSFSVYGGDGTAIEKSCRLCEFINEADGKYNDVKSCRLLYDKGDVCRGTVDTTVQWVRGFSVLHTRTTKSPDVCYKEVCMGGSCRTYPYSC